MSSDDTHRESSTDDNQTDFAERGIEMSRDRFECFECGFAAEDREEFDTQGLAMSCPECRSVRVEHIFTSDDDEDDRDLVADGGLPTCENCGETYLTETVAGPGEARRSCGCAFEPEFEVPDDTENTFANAAIRAMNATGDVETAALIHEDASGRLVADGGVPESFESLASTCENCGDDVDPERLIEGECPGCHYRPMADGGVSWYDLTGFKREVLRVLAQIKADGDTSYGLEIKRRLEERYEEEVNHSRLYTNLDDLVAAGLVEKSELDRRTNQYTLTDTGTAMLRRQKEAWDELQVPEVVALPDGGSKYNDPLETVDGETEVEIECAVAIEAPRACDGWCETIELDEPADYTGQIIELPGFDWECPECGNPHEFEIEGTRVSNLV